MQKNGKCWKQPEIPFAYVYKTHYIHPPWSSYPHSYKQIFLWSFSCIAYQIHRVNIFRFVICTVLWIQQHAMPGWSKQTYIYENDFCISSYQRRISSSVENRLVYWGHEEKTVSHKYVLYNNSWNFYFSQTISILFPIL